MIFNHEGHNQRSNRDYNFNYRILWHHEHIMAIMKKYNDFQRI